ncbi:MAG: hypothetical protein A2664_03560 [Candidatus Taylorbacteria bacterium RIFCSPHIGHO2_01_FULL_46_22b]|uniref:DUF5671 domain-containing protein n=1 Tax=Candidatus Taylorbacteria bacterium RIFCSPHIGHO2_01_FULL_46_22b TaxID=1802301 RepID=A0A1G2M3I7_9BACT|nr:MAG: hypothetical protein A2664_03560 [Candidatus Taylorbacteria bacterium RIFCSPHIGHO2_01_FULL_46_22b]
MNEAKLTPKDFFLHLGATIVLYVAAGALINLLFSVINYYNPDQLAGYFYVGSIAWPISMLVVLIPILYVLEWLINKDIAKTPEKANVWIRRWRVYLTLFLAVVLVGGDLIALINTYINGEITARFIYKILVVLLVGGMVGKYYFYSIYPQFKMATMARRTITWLGVVLVLTSIVLGFIAVGSPAKQRAIRFDNERVSDLSGIQWQIINQWQKKGVLPKSISELSDPISNYMVPADPETDASYGYTVKDKYTFEICADFKLPSQDNTGRGGYYGIDSSISYPAYPGKEFDTWKHEAGKACFERTIDPALYPVNPKTIY